MAKWFGKIGYESTVEEPINSGIWVETITEREYYGDIIRNTRRLQSTDSTNDNITISNQISILSDPFAINNFHSIRYATYMGVKWKVTSVDVQFPRLILELGGIYNGQQAQSASDSEVDIK